MKKFMVLFAEFELCVYADTKEEARKIALSDFISRMEKELKICEMKPKAERCDICQFTYIPSEIIERDGERICVYCYRDKFSVGELSPEDIPF